MTDQNNPPTGLEAAATKCLREIQTLIDNEIDAEGRCLICDVVYGHKPECLAGIIQAALNGEDAACPS